MTSLQDDPSIGDDEIVLRRVAQNEQFFDHRVGRVRPATSAFLQGGPDGLVSVYLMSETTIAVAAGGGSQEYLVAVSVGALRANGLGIIRTPESGGPGHCDITGRKTRGRLTRIVRQAQWLPGYAPPDGPD